MDHFRRKIDDKESRERYITDSYTKLSTAWMKKVERVENSRKRKERDAKARELYEKIFPELRKQREDKERDHRLGTRGAVRSEADIEDVIERLQEQEVSLELFISLTFAIELVTFLKTILFSRSVFIVSNFGQLIYDRQLK